MARRSVAPLLVGFLALLLYAGLAFLMYRQRGYDISRFVVAGHTFAHPAEVPSCLFVDRQSAGYDGQFFYRMATMPLSTREVVSGIRFDYPVYRQQRIGYPLLVWFVSLGQPCAVPLAMVLVNLAAIAALASLSSVLASEVGANALWGLVPALSAGLIFSLARNLAEPLALALLMGGFVYITREKCLLAAALFTAAVLTKETALLGVGTVLVVYLLEVVRHRAAMRDVGLLVIPIAVFIAWKSLLFRVWNVRPEGWANVFDVPFSAWAKLLQHSYTAGTHAGFVQVFELVAVLFITVILVSALPRSALPASVKIGVIVYGVFAFTLNEGIWVEDWAFLRALTEFIALTALVAVTADRTARYAIGIIYAGGWLLLAIDVLRYR